MSKVIVPKVYFLIALLLLLGALTGFPRIVDFCYWNSKQFFVNDCSYSKLRTTKFGIDPMEVRAALPSNAVLHVRADSTQKDRVFNVLRYQLYPLGVEYMTAETGDSACSDYVLDLSNDLQTRAREKVLKTGQRIYDFSGDGFSEVPLKIDPFSSGLRIESFLLLMLLQLIVGCLWLRLLKFRSQGLVHLFTHAYLAGLLLSVLLVGAAMLAGFTLTSRLIYTCFGVLGIVLLALRRFKLKGLLECDEKTEEAAKPPKGLYLALLAAVLLIALMIFSTSIFRPVDEGDASVFWLIKSKMMFTEGHFTFSSNIQHNDYPILLPLSVALNYTLLNGIADEMAMWATAVLFLCLLAQIYFAVLTLTRDRIIALSALMAYMLFFYNFYVHCIPGGDQLLMVFLSLSAINALLFILRSEHSYLLLSLFFALGMVLSKQEGFIYALMIGLLVALFSMSRKQPLRSILILLSYALLLFVNLGWKHYMSAKGYYSGNPDFTGEPITFQKVFLLIKTQVFNLANVELRHAIVILLLLILFIVKKRPLSAEIKFLLSVFLLSMMFVCFAILPWSTTDITNNSLAAVPRLFLQSSPIVIILIAVLINRSPNSQLIK
jgi:hypothetical protein